MSVETYDLVIVGGGVTGTALSFLATHYTNLENIAIIERQDSWGNVNSHSRNNSQTLHYGDIETNYTLEKALVVKRSGDILRNYIKRFSNGFRPNPHNIPREILYHHSKMVLGVGEKEVAQLDKRFETFGTHYKALERLNEDALRKIEPALVAKRKEPIVGYGYPDFPCGVDYQTLSSSFMQDTSNNTVIYRTEVEKIIRYCDVFTIKTSDQVVRAKAVVVCAGGHSLLFAHQMGYGLDYTCLPIAGSFYYTPRYLNGKVYTVQNDKLPFAAIHGDPDINEPNKTRFGPTAFVLPMLERYDKKSIFDYLRVMNIPATSKVMWDLLKVKDLRNYMLKNILFEIPFVRERVFLNDIRKIVPSLELNDLTFAHNVGGIRPQLIDRTQGKLLMGEGKIKEEGIIFNLTPSPGATSCLSNAEIDIKEVVKYLGAEFDQNKYTEELEGEPS